MKHVINSITDIRFQNFMTSVAFHLIAPLIPLILEFIYTGTITQESAILGASMYAFLVGVSSSHVALFAVNTVIGIILAGSYGAAVLDNQANMLAFSIPFTVIAVVMLTHGIERYFRHVKGEEPYFLFRVK